MRRLLDAHRDGAPLIEVFTVQIGAQDPAEQVLLALHPDMGTTSDLAEHESIAWAQTHDPDAVFVCADKRASLTALAELGRHRVAHPFDLWLDLFDRGWLSRVHLERLCRLTKKHDQGLPRLPTRVTECFPAADGGDS